MDDAPEDGLADARLPRDDAAQLALDPNVERVEIVPTPREPALAEDAFVERRVDLAHEKHPVLSAGPRRATLELEVTGLRHADTAAADGRHRGSDGMRRLEYLKLLAR
jgi:hypothetical protein